MTKKNATNNTNNRESLLGLIKDIHCFDPLKQWISGNNVFDILKISRTEIRHSNMLAWLFNPNESHGLEDTFLYDFIADIANFDNINKDAILKLLASDLHQVVVKREWNHIDILLEFPIVKTIIAIENKIGSQEHNSNGTGESQLITYCNKLEKYYSSEFTIIKIFLTPDGAEPTESDWLVLTYSELVNILQNAYESREQSLDKVSKILIKNYIEIIRKEIIMDNELIAICNEIYNKHKKAFDLIFENRDDNIKSVSEICKKKLEKIADNNPNLGIEIDRKNGKSFVKFWTENLIKKFKGLNKDYYFFQIEIRSYNGTIRIALKLLFHQDKTDPIQKEWIDKMNDLINKGKLQQGIGWEWKTAWQSYIELDDINSSEIDSWLDECFDKMKELFNQNSN